MKLSAMYNLGDGRGWPGPCLQWAFPLCGAASPVKPYHRGGAK